MKNIARTGAAGLVAPPHLRAIRDTGNQLLAAVDPNDLVGRLHQHGPSRVLTSTRCLDQPEDTPL